MTRWAAFHACKCQAKSKGHYAEVRVPLLRIAKNDTRIVSVRGGQPEKVEELINGAC